MKIAGARCEGEEGKWEVGAATKKKEALSLPSIHYSSIVYLTVCIFCPLSSSSLLHLSLHLFVTAACNSSFFLGGGGLGRRKSGELPWQQQAG